MGWKLKHQSKFTVLNENKEKYKRENQLVDAVSVMCASFIFEHLINTEPPAVFL